MGFQSFKTNSFCVDGRHRFGTVNLAGDIFSLGNKLTIGLCSFCNRKISMSVTDNTKQAEGLTDFFKNLG